MRKSPSRASASGRAAAGRKAAAKPAARRARKPDAAKSSGKTLSAGKTLGAVKTLNMIKASAIKAISAAKPIVEQIEAAPVAAPITVAQVTELVPNLRSHKFQVGQTVFYTSSPISRPGATGSYKVVRLLPSDGDDYQYRIKNPGEAFERVAKESQLEIEP